MDAVRSREAGSGACHLELAGLARDDLIVEMTVDSA